MITMKMRYFLSFLAFFLVFIPSTFAAVEEFSRYNSDISIYSNNTMKVQKFITLQNIHTVGIVPGQLEFKIDNADNSIKLLNYNITDRYGKQIRSTLRTTSDYHVIGINIFTPLLPGFEYPINIKYTLEFEPKGIFFKRLSCDYPSSPRIWRKS